MRKGASDSRRRTDTGLSPCVLLRRLRVSHSEIGAQIAIAIRRMACSPAVAGERGEAVMPPPLGGEGMPPVERAYR
jgi:hypothetical protein